MNGKEWYQWNRKQILMFITILTVMITTAVLQFRGSIVHSASDAEIAVNTTLGENLETYAGVFSTTVTASVNPTATLAALSILGMVERAEVYFPKADWLIRAGEFLNGIPIVKTISDLPIANPTAAVILTIVAIAMYVIHSTSASKMFSKATLDNIEQWGGMIVTVGLSLLPLATTQVVAATQDVNIQYVSPFTYAVTLIVAILSAIFTAVVYVCIYGCIDAVELIGAVVPIKGMNVIIETVKGVLHMILILLQIFSPYISVAVSVILMIAGILLFGKLSTVSTYYMYIYVKPLWKKIWHKNEMSPLVHKKFPRRGHKLYPYTELAIPVFSMNRTKKIKKRELLWLVMRDKDPYIVRLKPFRKRMEIPLSELNIHHDTLYMQKTFRFTKIRTEDNQVELIISNEYENQWQRLLDWLKLSDFKLVDEQKRREKEAARSRKEMQRQQKQQAREAAWEAQMQRLGIAATETVEAVETVQDDDIPNL